MWRDSPYFGEQYGDLAKKWLEWLEWLEWLSWIKTSGEKDSLTEGGKDISNQDVLELERTIGEGETDIVEFKQSPPRPGDLAKTVMWLCQLQHRWQGYYWEWRTKTFGRW